jgi:hypothetical protein
VEDGFDQNPARSGREGRAHVRAKSTPHLFVIDPQGKLIYHGAIDNKPTGNTADLANAQNYVKLALDSAMSGKPVATAITRPYGCALKY